MVMPSLAVISSSESKTSCYEVIFLRKIDQVKKKKWQDVEYVKTYHTIEKGSCQVQWKTS